MGAVMSHKVSLRPLILSYLAYKSKTSEKDLVIDIKQLVND